MQKISVDANNFERKLDTELGNVYPRKNFYSVYIKRCSDILISSVALLVLLPINLVIGIITFFDVGRPLFFTQKRIGKDLKSFTIMKFRNMRNTRGKDGNLLPPDERVTKFGIFVRKTSLDELLNFWNVFKGDMSIIGPRPLLPEYLPYYTDRQLMRHSVRPGLECPSLENRDHERSWTEQFEDDIWYIENISFLTDCKMIWALIKLVFHAKERAQRGGALRPRFDEECLEKSKS